MAVHHETVAAHRRHERAKRDMRTRHHHAHREQGERHSQEEADLHAKHEAEMAAEMMGTPGGAVAAPTQPQGAPDAAGPAGGQMGAQPTPAMGAA